MAILGPLRAGESVRRSQEGLLKVMECYFWGNVRARGPQGRPGEAPPPRPPRIGAFGADAGALGGAILW